MPTGPRPPIPPGVCKVVLAGTREGHRWAWVHYLQLTGTGIIVNDLTTLAAEYLTLYNANIKPLVPGGVILDTISLIYIPSVGNEVVYTSSVSSAGSGAGTLVADASACYVVQWKISAYYRGGHPRTYFTGPTTSVVTNGSTIDATSASAVATAFNTLRNALNAYTTTNISAIVMGTLSFAHANAWRTTPVFRPFTSVAVSHTLGSQRRRIHS